MAAKNPKQGPAGFCCRSGVGEKEIAEILALLPSGLAKNIPLAAFGGRHAPDAGTPVLASKQFLDICGAGTLDALRSVFSSSRIGLSQSLEDLAARLSASGEPAVERLRCRIGGRTRTVTLLCRGRRGRRNAPPLLAAAILDVSGRAKPAVLGASPRRLGQRPGSAGRYSGKDLELELRRQKAEFRELSAILDTAMDGVAVLDSQGRILSLNRSGEALFGYDRDEVSGQAFTCLFAAESRASALDYFNGLKSGDARSLLNQGCEVLGLTRRGGIIPVFMTLGGIGAASDPSEARFCALLRDLTHWKKVERELEEARREAERASAMKSDFLARVSHEIRTPLNAILGFAEVMTGERFGPIGNERYKTYLRDIHACGTLVMSLVNDLLDLAKIEAGKMEFCFASIDVNRIVSECVAIMQPQASQESVTLRLSLSPALPNVLADERSLRQIVLNLVSNAVKFNRPGGQVLVSTALADSGSAVIRFRDTGVGIAEADIGLAFEPFRRLSPSAASRGTGLGLPLTKALAEANHASLTLKSRENEGTLVEVAFPPARILAE
ncbi:MAG TPA: PAS domain-containing sensor histidine kinase [Methylocella sp.]|nr:PAS domain-containing sensor histidine kinase [Methylocella sp.]